MSEKLEKKTQAEFLYTPRFYFTTVIVLLVGLLLATTPAQAQTDLGGRGGAAGAGGPLPALSVEEMICFDSGKDEFLEVEDVPEGLGPRFNLDSCVGCHAHPAVGGTSPATNPQVARASMMAPANDVPTFISINGPVREARFKFVNP